MSGDMGNRADQIGKNEQDRATNLEIYIANREIRKIGSPDRRIQKELTESYLKDARVFEFDD